MKTIRLFLLVALVALLLAPSNALAQTYLFSLDAVIANVFYNEDGTVTIDYILEFTNNPSASPIDYVDVGLPNSSFDVNNISASVDGETISDISASGYQGSGTGVALGLGQYAIRPGKSGSVHIYIAGIRRVLYPDDADSNYVSAVFSPLWFGSQYVTGSTSIKVTFHLPSGVQPEEPRWHAAPSGFPSEPETALDEQGRVTYTWKNANASGSQQYLFGASFPKQYVPDSTIVRPSLLETLGISEDDLMGFTCCCGFAAIFIAATFGSYRSTQRRKLQYLPPKIAIEGHGIKRGLTAVEAALLLEQPLDKIMTMILFGAIKKGVATVVKREPLELQVVDPLPEDLQAYEKQLLQAFKEKEAAKRRKQLQQMTIDLVNALSAKMKGFSRKETIAYYQDIIKRAWAQVEAADTPEVKSERFDQVMEWTMLDKNYDDRTRDVFRSGPVFVPMWWPRYDPGYRGSVASAPIPAARPGSTPGGGVAMPHLPGSDFAGSIVKGVQSFSSGVVGNISEFTSGITNKTNPVPISTSRGSSRSSGGGGCACACACAGCACACAGGGR